MHENPEILTLPLPNLSLPTGTPMFGVQKKFKKILPQPTYLKMISATRGSF